MVQKGTYIYRLGMKVEILAQVMVEVGQLEKSTRRRFAEFLCIPAPTLTSACAAERISSELQGIFEKKCRLNPLDFRWNDTQVEEEIKRKPTHIYPARDTPQNFRTSIREQWKLQPINGHRLRGQHPATLDVTMASFSVSDAGQTTFSDQPLNAFFQLDIAPISSKGFLYGFQKAEIRLFLDEETQQEIRPVLGSPEAVSIADAHLRARGNNYQPFWDIVANSGILNGEYSTKDAPLFQLISQQPGYTIDAELGVNLSDGSLLRADGQAASAPARKAVIELLIRKKLEQKPDVTGRLALVVQTLKVEADDLV